jgi:hypothetical protein
MAEQWQLYSWPYIHLTLEELLQQWQGLVLPGAAAATGTY